MNIGWAYTHSSFKTFFSMDIWVKTLLEYIIPGRLYGQNVSQVGIC